MRPKIYKRYSEFGFVHQITVTIGDNEFDLYDGQAETSILLSYQEGYKDGVQARMDEESIR